MPATTRQPHRIALSCLAPATRALLGLTLVALPAASRAADTIPPAPISDLRTDAGVVRYVDRSNPAAVDGGPGTETAPWRTLLYAVKTARAGETVLIKRGAYNENENGRVSVANSGTSGAPITFSAYPGDERLVVITGAEFRIAGKSYVTVRGLKVTGVTSTSSPHGFYIEGNGTDITLSGNEVYDTYSSGIGVWGVPWNVDPTDYKHLFNVTIENNLIRRACNGGYNEMITISNGVNNVTVRNNEITESFNTTLGGEGIDFKEGVFGGQLYGNYVHNIEKVAIYMDAAGVGIGPGGVENIDIYGNTVSTITNGGGIEMGDEGRGSLKNIRVYNNIVHGAKNALLVYAHPTGSGTATNITLVNNTVYANYAYGVRIDWPATRATGIVARNIIGFQNAYGDYSVASGASATQDHNLWGIDPLFVNATGFDLRLRSGSPAVDKGSATAAPTFDFTGVARPQGSGFDIGAYEYSTGAPATAASVARPPR